MAQRDRYHRQRLLPLVGDEGQARLARSRAVIVGCGALGCVAAEWLCRAGVGRLTVVDRDVVEETNLQRQALFDESDAEAGLPKAEAARRRLARVNAGVRVDGLDADFEARSAERLAGLDGGADPPGVLIDGTDNFATRYLLNDLAVKAGVPLVCAGAVGAGATTFCVLPGETPCLRCLAPEPPPASEVDTCDTAGVLGPIAGAVASLQAAEAIKILLGRTGEASRRLTELDGATGAVRQIDLAGARDPGCPCCAERRFDFLEGRSGAPAAALCGSTGVRIAAPPGAEPGRPWVDVRRLADRLADHGPVLANEFLVRSTLESERSETGEAVELTVFADGRAIVRHTASTERARSIYARYVGA